MDSSHALSFDEAEFQLLFEQAGLTDTPEPNPQRVEKVIERSLHEKAIKDTASFVFQGFPAVLMGFMAVAANAVGEKDADYRA
ncbi:hypothetical protein IEN85_17100 [Pelagicoccus sp. NFK12]|uniref:Uncharacterized protein n=1 Tax=Pelagicoccus enzymogenes TaxID=2773457 RepID=A0A927FCF4_9BACT|nr:hypothetical protein [Pelagicoccus enzymogenes]MBD5781221.1 hypothetical protein [Pelagicoccus enzymogenes]MDQ8198877.1 hypothetical protein [Pelagicoccus enzymogenes]